MRRNLDRRVEAVTPIESEKLKKQIGKILDLYINDNKDAWEMKSDGSFAKKELKATAICAQKELMANMRPIFS